MILSNAGNPQILPHSTKKYENCILLPNQDYLVDNQIAYYQADLETDAIAHHQIRNYDHAKPISNVYFPKMPLILHHTSVFEQCKGLLIIPVDGISAGHEGAIGRQYIELFPEDWKQISRKVQYPIPFGSNKFVPYPEGKGFDFVLLASLLNHTGQVSKADYKGFVFNAVRQAMNLANGFEVERVASVVLRGGWRLNHDEAFMAMLDAYEHSFSFAKSIQFEIHETNQTRFRRIEGLARSLGWIE